MNLKQAIDAVDHNVTFHGESAETRFTFALKVYFSEKYAMIIATNGPIHIQFDVIDNQTMRVNHMASNVTAEWPHLAAVALAAARWRRRQNAEANA